LKIGSSLKKGLFGHFLLPGMRFDSMLGERANMGSRMGRFSGTWGRIPPHHQEQRCPSKETLIWNWFKLSKGWYGKPVGLHCDVIGEDVRDARIQRFFKEAQKKDPKFPGLLVGAQEPSRLLNRPVFAPLNRLQRKFR